MWIVPPVVGLIEPSIAPEISVDDVGAIEWVNGSIRVYLYAEQMPLERSAVEPDKVVMVKIRGPVRNVPRVISYLAACIIRPRRAPATQTAPPTGPFVPTLVR